MEEKLLKIINHYGFRNQLRKFNEETYELIEAMLDYKEPFSSKEHITEELADTMVLLEQFKLYYGITSEEITKIFWSKVDRQLERMKNE